MKCCRICCLLPPDYDACVCVSDCMNITRTLFVQDGNGETIPMPEPLAVSHDILKELP